MYHQNKRFSHARYFLKLKLVNIMKREERRKNMLIRQQAYDLIRFGYKQKGLNLLKTVSKTMQVHEQKQKEIREEMYNFFNSYMNV